MPPEFALEDFAKALRAPDAPLPKGIVDPFGNPAPKRFDVYRNNVTVSLIEALQAAFPAVCALVGEVFFREMARTYLRTHPPASPVMIEYGHGFAEFIEQFEPAASLPFLPDVARLDRAWLDVYHAADAQPLNPARLAGLNDDVLTGARFFVHPAVRFINSGFPLHDLWQAGRAAKSAAGIDPSLVQNVAITRPRYEIQTFGVTPVSAIFIRALMEKEPLGAAVEKVADIKGFDLTRVLNRLLTSGFFMDVEF